jgi:hypothetical protein
VLRPVPSFLSDLTLEVTDVFEFTYIPLFKDRSFLSRKYVEERLTPGEIAAEIFSCRTTIIKYQKNFGIPLRHEDEGYRNRSHLKYGEQVRKREIVAHKLEQAVIRKMRKLRDRGWSYWKIADVLNDWGVRTKSRRGKWHARTVKQILDQTENL